MKCRNCRKPIVRWRSGDEYGLDEWVHELTDRSSCDLFAAPDTRDYRPPHVGRILR